MTLAKLPNGRWRARIWSDGKDVPVSKILGGGPASFETKREARAAYDKARTMLGERLSDVTVRDWWARWTTEPVYERPKASTNIHNRERTRGFVERYGSRKLSQITRSTVAEWRESGTRDGTIPALRAMWNDAIRVELTDRNPFANLGVRKSRGNRDVDPPSEEMVRKLIAAARRLSGPSFAAWLQVAAFTGMRPGELDALRWDCVDFDASRIHVAEQFSSTSRTFTLPKNGKRRYAPLTSPAREALIALAQESEFCFVNLRGRHWTQASRAYHWRSARVAVGYEGTPYLAGRHFAGWYMTNVLDLPAAEVAIALGHEDGGRLVEMLYGHRDKDRTLSKVVDAYGRRGNVVPLLRLAEDA